MAAAQDPEGLHPGIADAMAYTGHDENAVPLLDFESFIAKDHDTAALQDVVYLLAFTVKVQHGGASLNDGSLGKAHDCVLIPSRMDQFTDQ
jgi:hypothetical protein